VTVVKTSNLTRLNSSAEAFFGFHVNKGGGVVWNVEKNCDKAGHLNSRKDCEEGSNIPVSLNVSRCAQYNYVL
jgi:hypothetical protein